MFAGRTFEGAHIVARRVGGNAAVLRGRTIDYNKTLAKVIAARDAELTRRGLEKITTEPE